MQPFQLISIQHELAMAIGRDRKLEELLGQFSKTATRRLGLAGVSWYLYDTLLANDGEEDVDDNNLSHFFSLPHVANPVAANPSDEPSKTWQQGGFGSINSSYPKPDTYC